jgi:hypothetical protein
LGTQNASLSDVCVWVLIIADFCTEIPNGSLDRPLRVTRQWANAYSLGGNMSQEVNTLSDEVDAVCTVLIIELLKFLCELAK